MERLGDWNLLSGSYFAAYFILCLLRVTSPVLLTFSFFTYKIKIQKFREMTPAVDLMIIWSKSWEIAL